MQNKKHLPMMGVGPVYGAVIIVITVIAVIAGRSTTFETGRVTFLKIPLLIIGILLIVLGVYLWAGALFFFYWIFMTVLMKCTEERWLKNLYGREYEEYCRQVNRCIPCFPKKQED